MVLLLTLQSLRTVPQKTTRSKSVAKRMQLRNRLGEVATVYRTHDNGGASTLIELHCIEGGKGGPAYTVMWGPPSAMDGDPLSHFRFSANLLLGGCTRNIESPSSEFVVGSVCDRSYPLAFACYVPKS